MRAVERRCVAGGEGLLGFLEGCVSGMVIFFLLSLIILGSF